MKNLDLISSYTRKEAIEDGVLIDVSETAKETGFKYPVAVTEKVQAFLNDTRENEDYKGRLWDLLLQMRWMLLASRKTPSDRIDFSVLFTAKHHPRKTREYAFYAIVGQGDNMEPVITLCFQTED